MVLNMPSNKRPAKKAAHVVGEDDPIEISAVRTAAPWWPYNIYGTYRLIRRGDLRAIAIGRRRYVTVALLRECLSRHTEGASAA